jgi:predicted acetyltransferase
MLKIRNLKKEDDHYICEYQPEGQGEWGVIKCWLNQYRKWEVVKLAENDSEDWEFYRRHIKETIEKALKLNKTEMWTMWY